ncbi:klaroid protein-like isoform X2 [Onthophagus taurus]
MPNMSRRSLRNTFAEDKTVFDKETSTEEHFAKRKVKPQVLFGNNNKYEGVATSSVFMEKFIYYFMKITRVLLFPLLYLYNNFQRSCLYVSKIFHRMASRIMLWDTWILQKNVSNDRRLYGILSLCLLPLIIFGGLWVLYAIITGLTSWVSTLSQNNHQRLIIPEDFPVNSLKPSLIEELGKKNLVYEEELKSKMNKFLDEVESLKRGNSFLQGEIIRMNQKISVDIKKCCRRSLLEIEGYVQKILTDFFGVNTKTLSKDDVEAWLKSIFVAKNDLESKIDGLTSDLTSNFDTSISHNLKLVMDQVSEKIKDELILLKSNQEITFSPPSNYIDEDRIKKIVSDTLSIYDADKTGLVDYAMESAGGYIISTRCTQIYHPKTAVISVFGIPIWYPSNTPRTVITPGNNPGQCWSFQNFPGFLVIKLYGFVKISGFSMEHVSVKLAPNDNISSAPKDFEVYGLKNENDLDAKLLGKYRYLNNGKSLQFFAVDADGDVGFDLVELKVFSNHGNPNYTCLYRFRVHGELIDGAS